MTRSRRNAHPTPAQSTDLGKRLIAARIKVGMTQRKLADTVLISRSYLCDLERGRGTRPSPAVVKALALALGVLPSELMPAEDVMVINDRSREIVDGRLGALEFQAQSLLDAVREMRQYLLVTQPKNESETVA